MQFRCDWDFWLGYIKQNDTFLFLNGSVANLEFDCPCDLSATEGYLVLHRWFGSTCYIGSSFAWQPFTCQIRLGKISISGN